MDTLGYIGIFFLEILVLMAITKILREGGHKSFIKGYFFSLSVHILRSKTNIVENDWSTYTLLKFSV